MTYGIMLDYLIEQGYRLYDWWTPYSLNGGKALVALSMVGLITDSLLLHGFIIDIFALPLIVGAVSWRVIAPREGLA